MTNPADEPAADQAPELEEDVEAQAPSAEDDGLALEALKWAQAQDGKEDGKAVTTAVPDAPLNDAAEAPAASEDAPDDTDPWADAPEPLRTAHQATQKEMADIRSGWERDRRRLSALTKKLATAPTATAQPPSVDLEAALAPFRDDYPDIGGAFDTVVAAIRGEIAPLKERFDAVDQFVAEDATNEQDDILLERVPDFNELMAAHGKAFWEWKQKQPPWVQRIANENTDFTVDGDATATIVEMFRASLKGSERADPPQSAAQAAPETRPDTRRERQLAGAATPKPGTRVPSAAAAPGGSGEALDALNYVTKAFPL